ncbi:hypothetical protein G4G28_14385 [Massilia sp. Dwa41.01b]|uniref:hypothetical protein n=1 Tax=unclassified Massilia TaxID=2609279 RepID=UPI001600B420|nr:MULTISPECIES: hypothetical protein [unclassified Massilia]QNA89367.1 hypothetical protein G4G28_14385 [Massilia sp. Dwa41.01b]QNB00262.1 hypothetical protein G4G31_17955 [Massilia sp. Se16.2.3]
MIRHFTRAGIAALLVASLPSVHAQSAATMNDSYAQMCRQSADTPKPFGEWDLKDNPKLGAYCDCFAPKFAARAMKAMAYRQANPGKAPPGTLEQSNAEELAMRNTCRKQVGLPAAVKPDLAGSAGASAGMPPGPKRK